MDQTTAQRLFEEGAFFIFLDVPEGTEFGIDMKTWNTGEKFRGVKMIPPGLHYVFYSAVSKTDDAAPRVGFFHHFKRTEVVVKRWDKIKEDIGNVPVSDAEIVSLKQNMKALDAFLGPYPYDILERWTSLSSHISDDLLRNLVPLSGQIRSALELQPCSDKDRPRNVKENAETATSSKKSRLSQSEDDLLPNLKPVEGTEIRLTAFPKKNYPDGATAAEITMYTLDLTYKFKQFLANFTNEMDMVGEMEFCFVCFLIGHSLEAFEQWKKIVSLFCSCDEAIRMHQKLYDSFISLLEVHVREIPAEFLADIVSNNNFVYVNLRKLFRTIESSANLDGHLKAKVERFKVTLTTTYMWDFGQLHDDEEDEAPVMVET